MSKYIPRLTAPGADDKNWIHTNYGGYNSCLYIGNKSCLPNCVGYAWGRWRELLGKTPNLSRSNAENWWNTKDGYERGQTPKVGAVICWRKGKAGVSSDGAGHVAIVEQIKADGSIVTSNSAYNGTRFYLKTIKPPYEIGSAYAFQGFIYIPLTFDEDTTNNNLVEKEQGLTFEVGEEVKLASNATYYNGAKMPSWLFNRVLYVRKVQGDKIVISTLKTGDVTGTVHKKYLIKNNPVVLNEVKAQLPTLRKGCQEKAYVRMIQGFLSVDVDGDFGPKTEAAVKAFQKSKGLEQDGIVGKQTWSALLGV